MKSSQATLMVIGFILLTLMATNPTIQDHRQAVLEKFKEKMANAPKSNSRNQWQEAGEAIGMALGQGIVEKAVGRDNYLLFSLTKISFGESTKNIGFGVLGKVFISNYDDFEQTDLTEKTEVKETANYMQDFKHEDVQIELAFATEGNDYSIDEETYKLRKYIVSSYGSRSYIRINNKIEVLENYTNKNLSNGQVNTYSNENYKIIINKNKIEPLANALMDGMVVIEGIIELYDRNGVLLQTIPHFYCEGF
jgi:hypothetical protein